MGVINKDSLKIALMTSHPAEIYVMDADGGNPQNLTNHTRNDVSPAWFVPAFAVAPAGKKFTIWGQLKQGDR